MRGENRRKIELADLSLLDLAIWIKEEKRLLH